jgi:hypothetical protein
MGRILVEADHAGQNIAPVCHGQAALLAAKSALMRAGIAHLWFESIHPFEDGNGRLGRAIAEKALAQGLDAPAITALAETVPLTLTHPAFRISCVRRPRKEPNKLDARIPCVPSASASIGAGVLPHPASMTASPQFAT